jgi:predicted DNA-binding transcriptional regulator YafY
MDERLVRAIVEKRVIEFTYKSGGPRVVEPHDYGVRGSDEQLLGYQLGGYSRSRVPHGWRVFEVADIFNLRLLDRNFPGSRSDSSQLHREWDRLFARVK